MFVAARIFFKQLRTKQIERHAKEYPHKIKSL